MQQTVSFEVRRAVVADAGEIAAAHLDSIRSIGVQYYDAAIVDDWSAGIKSDLYASAMACGEVFYVAIRAAAEENVVLGFSSHRIHANEHRTAVYVRGEAVRCGVGSALFHAAETAAIAARATSIRVDASLAAIDFYRRNGFEEVSRGLHRLPTGRPMACAFMRKNLTTSR